MAKEKDISIGITHIPHDPTDVTYIPRRWSLWLAERKIDIDMNAVGTMILYHKLDYFDAAKLEGIVPGIDRDKMEEILQRMAAVEMIRPVGDGGTSGRQLYSVHPQFIYDPETGTGRA